MPIAKVDFAGTTIAHETRFDEPVAGFEQEAMAHQSEHSSSGLRAFGTHCNTGADQKRGGQHRLIAAIYAPLVRQGC